MTETNEVSLHQLKIYDAVKRHSPRWITAKEVAKVAGVAERTSRLHCLRLVKMGIFDQAEVFPAHRYRLSEFADKRNKAYVQRLTIAADVFANSAYDVASLGTR